MNILQILAADKEVLIYRKELNTITKKVTATILLQQMIYWHSKMGGDFYKFIEPCKNTAYNEGDSWCEELGFSVKEFGTAYKALEDLGIVTKKISMNRVTYYHLDVEVIGKLLNGVYVDTETALTKTPKGDLDITETTFPETTSGIINTPLTPQCEQQGGKKVRKKTMTRAEIGDLHCFTVSIIEDFIIFRLNSGGIDNPDAFEKYLLRELSSSTSSEVIKLEEWFNAWEEERPTIEALTREFVSIPSHWFNRSACRERGKDGFANGLIRYNIPGRENIQTIVIEIAYQLAEQASRDRLGGVA